MLTLHIAVSNMQKVSILIDAIEGMMWQCIDMCRRWYNILGANEPWVCAQFDTCVDYFSTLRFVQRRWRLWSTILLNEGSELHK